MTDDLRKLREHLASKEQAPTSLVEMYRRASPLEKLDLLDQLRFLLTHKKGGVNGDSSGGDEVPEV